MCQEASRINRNTNTTINTNMNVNNSTATTSTEVTATPIQDFFTGEVKEELKVKRTAQNKVEREKLEQEKDKLIKDAEFLSGKTLPKNVQKIYGKIKEYCNIKKTEACAIDATALGWEMISTGLGYRTWAIRKELHRESKLLKEIETELKALENDANLDKNFKGKVATYLEKVIESRGGLSIQRDGHELNDKVLNAKEWKKGKEYDFSDASCKKSNAKYSKKLYKDILMNNRRNEPLFAHEPNIEDIIQGGIGDCALLSFLIAIAKMEPESIRENMLDNDDGTATVRFFEKDDQNPDQYNNVYITVNKVIPRTGAKGALWVQVMEKAFAAFKTYKKQFRKDKTFSCNTIDYSTIEGGISEQEDKGLVAKEIVEELLGRKGTITTIHTIGDSFAKELLGSCVQALKEAGENYVFDPNDSEKLIFANFVLFCEDNLTGIKDKKGYIIKDKVKERFLELGNEEKLKKFLETEYKDKSIVKENFWKKNEKIIVKENFWKKNEKIIEKITKNIRLSKKDVSEEDAKKKVRDILIRNIRCIAENIQKVDFGIRDLMSGDYSNDATKNFDIIATAVAEKKLVSVGTIIFDKGRARITGEKKENGIADDHAYAVLGVKEINGRKFIKLRNPWGEYSMKYTIKDEEIVAKEYKHARNGEFFIEMHHFMTLFRSININEAKEAHNAQIRNESGAV